MCDLTPVMRKSNGTLPRLTAQQQYLANRIIRSCCSNYDDGRCLLLDENSCPQMITKSVICRFFRHVLLEDQQGQLLKVEIFNRNTLKTCFICGSKYQSVGNRAKYCEICKRIIHRKQKTESKRKKVMVDKQRSPKPLFTRLTDVQTEGVSILTPRV